MEKITATWTALLAEEHLACLVKNAGRFTLSLGHSTHTIPPIRSVPSAVQRARALGPHGAAAQHTTRPSAAAYIDGRTDRRAESQRPARLGVTWGRLPVKVAPVRKQSSPCRRHGEREGDPIPRPANCQSAPSQTRGQHMRVAARRAEANVASSPLRCRRGN